MSGSPSQDLPRSRRTNKTPDDRLLMELQGSAKGSSNLLHGLRQRHFVDLTHAFDPQSRIARASRQRNE